LPKIHLHCSEKRKAVITTACRCKLSGAITSSCSANDFASLPEHTSLRSVAAVVSLLHPFTLLKPFDRLFFGRQGPYICGPVQWRTELRVESMTEGKKRLGDLTPCPTKHETANCCCPLANRNEAIPPLAKLVLYLLQVVYRFSAFLQDCI